MKHLLKTALARLGYRVQGTRYFPRQLLETTSLRAIEFDDVVCRRMFEFGPEFSFIQVGAFDGITRDPLRKYISKCGWRGVVVEPQAGLLTDDANSIVGTIASSFCRLHWTANPEGEHSSLLTPKPPPRGLADSPPFGARPSSNIPISFRGWRR